MLSSDVAEATSTRMSIPVISRETVHSGPIVKMKIPIGATEGAYPHEGEKIPFVQFCHFIPGGRVNFFLHTADASLRGKTVTAAASVQKKTLQDGREYLYVDLIPVAADTSVTHRLAVMNNVDGSWDNKDQLIFSTPRPLKGVIIFVPPEAKVIPVSANGRAIAATATAPKKPSGDDSQLDRLIADGWKIESENAAQVHLFKMKGGVRKHMTHNRHKAR